MNRLLSVVPRTLSRRTVMSSAETGGHMWYRQGYSVVQSHPSSYRYMG